jgi:homocysteine S-methyltransferase
MEACGYSAGSWQVPLTASYSSIYQKNGCFPDARWMKSAIQFAASSVHILDGGMATELERRGCNISGLLWSAHVLDSSPDVIHQVHLDYLRAGADCISTASYQVSALGYTELERPRSDAAQALRQSVEIAERAREEYARESDRSVLIAASLGPYGAALHNGAEFHGRYEIGFDELVAFHAERLAVVAETDADVIALETIPSLEEARAILEALSEIPSLRAWLSFTCKDESHVAHGEPLAECAALIREIDQVVAVGINCTQPRLVKTLIGEAKAATDKPVFVYPNSGEIWDAASRRWRGISDVAEYGALAREWFASGAQAVGGCCRTTPEHIKAVRAAWEEFGVATVRQ